MKKRVVTLIVSSLLILLVAVGAFAPFTFHAHAAASPSSSLSNSDQTTDQTDQSGYTGGQDTSDGQLATSDASSDTQNTPDPVLLARAGGCHNYSATTIGRNGYYGESFRLTVTAVACTNGQQITGPGNAGTPKISGEPDISFAGGVGGWGFERGSLRIYGNWVSGNNHFYAEASVGFVNGFTHERASVNVAMHLYANGSCTAGSSDANGSMSQLPCNIG